MILDERFPDVKLPISITNPVLRAFARPAWNCPSAAAVAVAINQAHEVAQ
jgi:hypothetical protein